MVNSSGCTVTSQQRDHAVMLGVGSGQVLAGAVAACSSNFSRQLLPVVSAECGCAEVLWLYNITDQDFEHVNG